MVGPPGPGKTRRAEGFRVQAATEPPRHRAAGAQAVPVTQRFFSSSGTERDLIFCQRPAGQEAGVTLVSSDLYLFSGEKIIKYKFIMFLSGTAPMEYQNDEILHELHGQLKAASRIVQSLKNQIQDLKSKNEAYADSERKLLAKLADRELLVKELTILNQTTSFALTQEKEKSVSEAKLLKENDGCSKSIASTYERTDNLGKSLDSDKKLKLAQDHMAKLIARHRNELQEYMSKVGKLNIVINKCKVFYSYLQF